MRQSTNYSRLAAAVSACLLASAPAYAVTSVESNAGPQFNFVNPGARSLGMGGAFVGIADDSTAAYTNPAGLGQLSRKEWSIEGRESKFTTNSVRGGRLLGTPTGIGLDTVGGLQSQDTSRNVGNLAFLSFAFPLKHGTIAVYRHELANFEAGWQSDGPFTQTQGTSGVTPIVGRVLPTKNDVDLKIANYGFAGSWRVTPHFMLGGSLNFYQFDLDTITRRYSLDANGNGSSSPLENLTTLDFSDSALFSVSTQKGNDSHFGFNIGMLWQPNDKFSLGAVYRKGPHFQYDFTRVGINPVAAEIRGTSEFNVPDVWAVGLGYRPSDSWRIAFDAAHVTYSDYAKNVETVIGTPDPNHLHINDGTELRIGAEYTALEAKHPYSIRFGAWHDPDHQLFFSDPIAVYSGTPLTPRESDNNFHAALWQRGKDAMHYTLGYGVIFDKFQIDTAVDISHPVKILSLSMVYYLK